GRESQPQAARSGRSMTASNVTLRAMSIVSVIGACGCATALTPQGAHVGVYQASSSSAPAESQMPDGCRLVATKPPVSMAEVEMTGKKDPFRTQRNEAGAAGANALLVRSRVTMPRRSFECPSAMPITDCPGSSGAWFDVVFETYSCTPESLEELAGRKK